MRRLDFYAVKEGDDLADPSFWLKRFQDIDLRLAAREDDAATLDAAIAALEAIGLQRISDTFLPLVNEAKQRLDTFGVSFTGESTSSVTIGTGEKYFTLTEATRQGFYYTDYVAIRPVGVSNTSLLGQVVSYDRPTGILTVDVVQVAGSGTYANWDIHSGSPPDTVHASRTDNPHVTTAAQVGAYTSAATDAAIAAAIAAIPGVDLSSRLARLSNLSDLTDVAAARVNLALGALAVLDSVGYGDLASNIIASVSDIRANAASKLIGPNGAYSAGAYVSIAEGSLGAWSMDSGFNFYTALTASRTVSFPSSVRVPKSGFWDFTQPAGGNCTVGWAAGFTFDGGVPPSIDLGGSRTTSVFWCARSTSEIRVGLAFKGAR